MWKWRMATQKLSCTNSGEDLRRCCCRLGTIIQSIFCAQPGTSIRLTAEFENSPVRVGTQGLFRPCSKTFVAPTDGPTDCPWVFEDEMYQAQGQREIYNVLYFTPLPIPPTTK